MAESRGACGRRCFRAWGGVGQGLAGAVGGPTWTSLWPRHAPGAFVHRGWKLGDQAVPKSEALRSAPADDKNRAKGADAAGSLPRSTRAGPEPHGHQGPGAVSTELWPAAWADGAGPGPWAQSGPSLRAPPLSGTRRSRPQFEVIPTHSCPAHSSWSAPREHGFLPHWHHPPGLGDPLRSC